MEVRLPYGKGYVKVEVPDNAVVFEGKGLKPLDSLEAVRRALANPAGSMPLAGIIRAKGRVDSVCIVVSDHTRAVPNRIILPCILEETAGAGIPPERITILIASGMHRPTTRQEKTELLGEEIAGRYRVVDHDARNPEGLLRLKGGGGEFLVNRMYAEANLKILTGLIEPHFMAGFSGGRKSICPGIAGMDTIQYFHSPALLESPCASTGTLDNNPCHIFASEMAKAAGADFIVNVTLDKEKRITGVFAGDPEKAHAAGAEHCRKESLFYAERPFDVVVTTNGGYPLDRDLYQTVKGLVSATDIVAEGGEIICAAECIDGMGSKNFRELLFGMESLDGFIEKISAPGFFVPDQWEVEELIKVLRKASVKIYSGGLTEEEIRKSHMTPVKDISAAIMESMGKYGEKASVAVIPDGPYTMVKIK